MDQGINLKLQSKEHHDNPHNSGYYMLRILISSLITSFSLQASFPPSLKAEH